MTLSLGSVIYISVKPIFKIYLILAVGFYLAKKNILSVDTARDFSKIVIDVLLPCLAFNKIVTNISNNNIAEIGTIAIIFTSFSCIGLVLSLLISFFLIPKNLRNRLRGTCLSIGIFPNISDLPIAYLQTFQTNSTFTTDQVDKGVAYSMIFMTLQLIVQFNLGGYYLVGMDMKNELKYQEKLELNNQLVDQNDNDDDDETDLESQKKIIHNNNNNSTNSLSSSDSIKESQIKINDNNTELQSHNVKTLQHKLHTLNDIEDLESIDSNLSNYPLDNDENGELSHQQFLKTKNSIRSNTQSHLNPNYNHNKMHNNNNDNFQQNSGILLKILKSNDSKIITGSSSSHHKQNEFLHKRDNTHSFQQSQQLSISNDLRKMPSQTMNDVIRVYSKVNELNQGKVQLQYDGSAEESPLAKVKSIQSILQNSIAGVDREITTSSQDDDDNDNNIKNYKNGEIEFDDLTTSEKFKVIKKMITFKNIQTILKKFVMLTITSCTKPISIVTIISIIVCMIPWLKALFVITPQAHLPNAPDNQPPLSFIMDFTAYIGQAQVPIGIILLGGTMARLEMKQMPKGLFIAPLCLTIMRLVIFPIIGISISTKLYKDGLYYNDQILHFLCNIDWCLPSATSLIYVAASYTKKDSNNHLQIDMLAIVYLSQYALLVICLPFVTTYTIKVSLGD
ncbi:hypothetical protein B5S28_g4045 [[Candida] boidinii]|nr:hypothetical protein B5S28_g4045 [[Candida] boidinii]